jgi:hypothetical protein
MRNDAAARVQQIIARFKIRTGDSRNAIDGGGGGKRFRFLQTWLAVPAAPVDNNRRFSCGSRTNFAPVIHTRERRVADDVRDNSWTRKTRWNERVPRRTIDLKPPGYHGFFTEYSIGL